MYLYKIRSGGKIPFVYTYVHPHAENWQINVDCNSGLGSDIRETGHTKPEMNLTVEIYTS